ncbi:hypothetical protein H632_c4397p0, partial [Helicosporidium sp. ATCC 50920]
DVERPDFAHASPPTSLGSEVLSLIADATCGGPPLPHSSFMQRMLASTLAQARAARDLCVASLLDSVSSDNSISLLAVSEACGCAALSRRARSRCLSRFAQVSVADYGGLVGAPEALLISLLTDDSLRVRDETEPFRAVMAWVEAAPEVRGGRARDLVASCVRLPLMSMEELSYVEAHPLVLGDRSLLALVAAALLAHIMGVALDAPFGVSLCSRPRRAGG